MLRKRQKQTIKNVNSPYTKADLRKKAHATLQTILKNNPEKLVTASAVICEKIKQLTAYKEIDTLLVYWPHVNEVNIMPVIDDAMKINKKVYFINYDIQDPAKTDFYHNRLITKLNEINQQKYFKQDGYQIWNPDLYKEGWMKWQNQRSLIIVPTLVFNHQKQRIGKGLGCYDYFMNNNQGSFTKVGVAFNFQKVMFTWSDQEEHDVDLDQIITD